MWEFLADGFKIPIKCNIRFNVIHMDSVLHHHLIGRTRGKSISLIEKMLRLLIDKLDEDGIFSSLIVIVIATIIYYI